MSGPSSRQVQASALDVVFVPAPLFSRLPQPSQKMNEDAKLLTPQPVQTLFKSRYKPSNTD